MEETTEITVTELEMGFCVCVQTIEIILSLFL